MKIILSDEDIVKLVYEAFVNGGLSEFGHSDIELKFFNSDYIKAKDILKVKPPSSDTICYEDVLVQLFKDGKLIFIDHNDDCKYEFTPAFVRANLDEVISGDNPDTLAVTQILLALDDESGPDAWVHYNILQWMVFKEIVYG